MVDTRRLWWSAALTATFAAVAPAHAAGLIDPFGRSATVQDPEDWNLLKKSVRDVLTQYKEGAVSSWKGKTGHGGQAKVLRVYQSRGLRCAEVQHEYTAGGGDRYILPFCQVADGSWKLAL